MIAASVLVTTLALLALAFITFVRIPVTRKRGFVSLETVEGRGYLLTVYVGARRNDDLETWFLPASFISSGCALLRNYAVREGDGLRVTSSDRLYEQLEAMVELAQAREAQRAQEEQLMANVRKALK